MDPIVACPTCGLVQTAAPLPAGHVAKCARCGFKIHHRRTKSAARTAALAAGALVLYVPANMFPIAITDYWGAHAETTIWDGVSALWSGGSWFVGGLVFCTSILTPFFKITGLLFLSLTVRMDRWQMLRTRVFRTIRFLDPWNMLEVTLLSILVATAELGRVATVVAGPGVFSFAGVVVLTICATLAFDTRLIWDSEERNGSPATEAA